MKRLSTLTLCTLLTISCSIGQGNSYSKSSTMNFNPRKQAELDQAHQRIHAFKADLLKQGFREVSVSFFNSKETYVLEGKYGSLKDLRITLQTRTSLEEKEAELSGGVQAYIRDDQAGREFDELYKKVSFVVTGRPE